MNRNFPIPPKPRLIIFITLIFTCQFLPQLVFAQEPFFSQGPLWITDQSNQTKYTVAGDIDGDGTLDFICANYNQANTLYLNQSDDVSPLPAWSSGPSNRTLCAALGDIDGDGDLDLICGNEAQSNTIYINNGGMLSRDPVWSSKLAYVTNSVSLGDVDNDGDLDIVFGNWGKANTLYINNSGVFSTEPDWTSNPTNKTWSIALGDLDKNGYLDLVCGNGPGSNTVYMNASGVFPDTASWSSAAVNQTRSVALGDVNGDGFLDIVCGNLAQSNTLYLNLGISSIFPLEWESQPAHKTFSVDLGDVDWDGDLDLVCGNSNEENTLYLNNGAGFPDIPVWDSGDIKEDTRRIELCDMDGDGKLDLICGNYNQPNQVFRNIADTSFLKFGWRSISSSSGDAALGDMDGDGDLDLVTAGWRLKIYINSNGTLPDSPSWTHQISYDRACGTIDLADVDGDGDLDVACGYQDISNKIFLNEGGVFQETPHWESDFQYVTMDVAFGDVDGDGDPDLAVANYHEVKTVYLNNNGHFPTEPSWVSVGKGASERVAFGDIDGDNDLDLVVSNWGQSNVLFLNNGKRLRTSPSWASSNSYTTKGIALGDVDGDGDLDLVCANLYEASTLYLNNGTTFDVTTAWTFGSGLEGDEIAMGDLDSDLDLDLVIGNYGPDHVYLNENGLFPTSHSWEEVEDRRTVGIAIGDIDEDGDNELVLGKSSRDVFYRGCRYPDFRGNPIAPIHHLPNNPAILRFVRLLPVDDNLFQVNFAGIDVESDPIHLLAEIQRRGSGEWLPVDIASPLVLDNHSGSVGPFASSPAGIEDSLEIDFSRITRDPRDTILRFRVVSVPMRVSSVQLVSSYQKEIGPVIPIRAELTTSVDVLQFPLTTIGDTTVVEIIVGNVGNKTLTITQIELPSAEMQINRTVPILVEPGETDTITVSIEPITPENIYGNISITSNDPFIPVKSIEVQTDIHSLEFTTKVLSLSDTLPLGEAVTFEVTPNTGIHIDGGLLFYRAGGTSTFGDSIRLVPFVDGFIAILPGAQVTEAGLEYYVRTENYPVSRTDPPGAPASYYTRRVSPPVSVVSNPRPTSGSEYLEGREVDVQIILDEGVNFVRGALHYRQGGESEYMVDSLVLGEFFPKGTIPSHMLGARGIEYWVDVHTQTRNLSDPPFNPAEHPKPVLVTVQDLQEQTVHPGMAYRMVSIPLLFGASFSGTIEALLTDQGEFGPYDPKKWRSYRYVTASETYAELSDTVAEAIFRPRPGKAFWIVSKSNHRITTAPILGKSTPLGAPYRIPLSKGWNQIGNPFVFPVAWDSVRVDTLAGNPITMVEAESTVVEPPIRWDAVEGYQFDINIIESFEGYWVKSLADSLVLLVPPREAPPDTSDTSMVFIASVADISQKNDWRIQLEASTDKAKDSYNFVGIHPNAREEWDPLDHSEPPMSPGSAVALYFPHTSWRTRPANYTTDIRSKEEPRRLDDIFSLAGDDELWGYTWHFDVTKNYSEKSAGDAVSLSFQGMAGLPDDAIVYLVDYALDKYVAIDNGKTYTFYLQERERVRNEEDARFVLLVGSEAFMDNQKDTLPQLPGVTTLHQNYPNPFNPSTVIRYDVSLPGRVSLKVYDARGALVKVLYHGHREQGRYEAGWDGKNERGTGVTTGIYFYCLETNAGFRETKKMVLLK